MTTTTTPAKSRTTLEWAVYRVLPNGKTVGFPEIHQSRELARMAKRDKELTTGWTYKVFRRMIQEIPVR